MEKIFGIPFVLLTAGLLLCACSMDSEMTTRETESVAAADSYTGGGTGKEQAAGVTKQSFYFDTIVQMTVYDMEGMNEEAAGEAINHAFSLCASYENLLSRTKEGSDIWKINHAKGVAVKVDPETINVIEKGIYYGNLSNGKFDITIGRAQDLWDFHAQEPHVPEESAVARAITHVDYRKILIDVAASTVALSDPDMEIDLGGIGKGYIADKVCDQLREDGVTSAIVSLGGNIETVGGKPASGKKGQAVPASDDAAKAGSSSDASSDDSGAQIPFTIGIETPYSDMSRITGSVQVMDGTVVTSGVYEQYFTIDNTEYHHILDPSTGYPARTDVLGVTVTAPADCSADADALSTTCLILGSQRGKELIETQEGFEAAFILRDDSVITTTGMQVEPAD